MTVLFICISFLAIQSIYWLLFFLIAGKLQNPKRNRHFEKVVSVVICCKNEYENLKNGLDSLLHQSYTNYEIVIMDDFSTDGTKALIQGVNDPKLKYIHASKDRAGKKLALKEAIEFASNPWILVTDADCIPASPNWITRMLEFSQTSTQIKLGYGPYLKKAGMLNAFVRFETLIVAMQYFSMAICKKPYMGVGRNMIYSKEFYQKSLKNIKGEELPGGDDDLLISASKEKDKFEIEIHPESFTYSQPVDGWLDLFKQKLRHVSTSIYYDLSTKMILAAWALSHFGFYISLIFLLFTDYDYFVGYLLLIRLTTILLGLLNWAKALKEEDLIIKSIILDPLLSLYYIVLGVLSVFIKPSNW